MFNRLARPVLLAMGLLAWGPGLAAPASVETELVMVERDGCIYCARWMAEIGPIYPRTPEAALAPLRRIDIDAPRPPDLTFDGPLVITPTFVLVADGVELGRIEGYGGDEMFWAMLSVLLRDRLGYRPQEIPQGGS